MGDWAEGKTWSDQFLLEVKSLLGMHLIATAPLEDDRERNTDLIVLSLGSMRIGVRIRDYKYYEKFGSQFTIRSRGRNGAKTELQKIIDDGFGDYFFYGFGDDQLGLIKAWCICRLDIFRKYYSEESLPGIGRENFGYDTCFRAFYWRWFPPEFIVAQELGEAFDRPVPKPVSKESIIGDRERLLREFAKSKDAERVAEVFQDIRNNPTRQLSIFDRDDKR